MRGKRLTWLALGVLCALACDSTSSSPSDPSGSPIAVYEGLLEPDATDFQGVDFGNGQTFLIQVDSLEFVVGEPPTFGVLLGVGIGFLNAAGDACASTSSRLLSVGDDWILHLSGSNYCLNFSDPGIFPDETVVSYRVLVFEAFD